MATVDAIVRNDEVVGSIPTSSTIFSVTYSGRLIGSCPILSQKVSLPCGVCLTGTQQSNLDRLPVPFASGRLNLTSAPGNCARMEPDSR